MVKFRSVYDPFYEDAALIQVNTKNYQLFYITEQENSHQVKQPTLFPSKCSQQLHRSELFTEYHVAYIWYKFTFDISCHSDLQYILRTKTSIAAWFGLLYTLTG